MNKEITAHAKRLMKKTSKYEAYTYTELFSYTSLLDLLIRVNENNLFLFVLKDIQKHLYCHNAKSYGKEINHDILSIKSRYTTPVSLHPIIYNELDALEEILVGIYENALENIYIITKPQIEETLKKAIKYRDDYASTIEEKKTKAVSIFNNKTVEDYSEIACFDELNTVIDEIDNSVDLNEHDLLINELKSILAKESAITTYDVERLENAFNKISNVGEENEFHLHRAFTMYKSTAITLKSLVVMEEVLNTIRDRKSLVVF